MTPTFDIDPDAELIISAHETPDDLGKILRVHLAVETMMDYVVNNHSRAKVDGRTTFWAKVNLMRAMGIPEKLCASCEAIAKLRNQFAHNPRATLANNGALVAAFLTSVEAFFPKLPMSNGEFVRRKENVRYPIDFATASQGDRVVVAASFLTAVLAAIPKMYALGERPRMAIVAGFDP